MANELNSEARISTILSNAKGRPWVLDRLGRLAAIGDSVGASPEIIAEAMNAYLKTPEDWNFGLQEKTLLCKAWELPDDALNTPLTVGDLIELVGNIESASGEAMDVVRNPKTWQKIKLRGRGAKRETDQIIIEVWAEHLGVPEDTAFRLTLKQLSDAAVGLQQRGLEGAISRPEFWDDYLHSPNKLGVFETWQAKIQKEERIADARREKEIRQRIMEFNQAAKKRESELEELRRLREQDRQRRIVEERRRKRLRRQKRPRATVTTSPEGMSIVTMRQVSTPWGNNYILLSYQDDTAELIRIEPNGKRVVVAGRQLAYLISETSSGMLHVIPVIGHRTGRRRASPMDLPPGQKRGPLGTEP